MGHIHNLPRGVTFENHVANVLAWRGEQENMSRDDYYHSVSRYAVDNNLNRFALWLAVQG